MSSNETNPLLQSAHLRNKGYNTQPTIPVHDPERNLQTQYTNNYSVNREPEESFCNKYCNTFNVLMFLGTVLMLLVILILLIVYH
jgi:hypothetical protein